MARPTPVKVNSSANVAAIVGIVAVTALTVTAMLAVVAMVLVGMVIASTVACVALSVLGFMRYTAYRADSEAALWLWRYQLRLEAARTEDAELRDALLADLDEPPKPQVALAMRRLQDRRPTPTPAPTNVRALAGRTQARWAGQR